MIDFRLLGPFEALADGVPVALPAGRPRALLARLLLAPAVSGGGPLSRCSAACPPNPLQIASAPGLLSGLADALVRAGLAVTVGVVARFVWRLRTASRPQRRALVAVAATSLLLLPTFFAYHLAASIGPRSQSSISFQ